MCLSAPKLTLLDQTIRDALIYFFCITYWIRLLSFQAVACYLYYERLFINSIAIKPFERKEIEIRDRE